MPRTTARAREIAVDVMDKKIRGISAAGQTRQAAKLTVGRDHIAAGRGDDGMLVTAILIAFDEPE